MKKILLAGSSRNVLQIDTEMPGGCQSVVLSARMNQASEEKATTLAVPPGSAGNYSFGRYPLWYIFEKTI
jgi:hypothetical protein